MVLQYLVYFLTSTVVLIHVEQIIARCAVIRLVLPKCVHYIVLGIAERAEFFDIFFVCTHKFRLRLRRRHRRLTCLKEPLLTYAFVVVVLECFISDDHLLVH